jgi:hypothetical protein
MSDTSNNEAQASENTGVVTQTPVVNPTPVSETPVQTMPVQEAPVVSAEPKVATPPVPINVPTEQTQVAAPVEAPVPSNEPVAPVEAQKTSVIDKIKGDIEDSSLFSGPVESKTTDSLSSDLAVPEDPKSTITKGETTTQSSDKEEFVADKENKKLPIAVLLIFVILLVAVAIYYFIVMTPTKVFDKAIDNIFDSVTGVVDSAKNSKTDTAKLKISVDMETDGDINKYLDGVLFSAAIDVDLRKLQLGLQIESETGETKIAEDDNFDSHVFVKDGGIYVTNKELNETYPGKVALYSDVDFNEVDYDRIDNAVAILERTKNEIVNIIDNDQLRRTITIKRVNNQTTIALKASCTLNNKDITEIYKPIFKKYLNDKEFIKQVTDVIGTMSEEEVKDEIQRLYDRTVVTENIDVNIYMNLANTQLISLDVTVDDYYVQLDNLNGYFYGVIKYKGVKKNFVAPEFLLQFEYDANKGLVNGYGQIDKPGQAFVYSLFDYTRKENKEGKKIGNDLNINFFNKVVQGDEQSNKKNIIARLKCKLDIDDDNPKITILGKEQAVAETEDIKNGMNESMNRLTHYVDYVFRTLLYSLWDDEKYISEKYKEAVVKRVERNVKNDEDPIDVGYIKKEVQEAKNYCNKSGTYAYIYNGASKTVGQFDGFPLLDDALFKWICLYSNLSIEKEKEYNFTSPDDLDYDGFEKAIADKLKELNVKQKNVDIDIESITITPQTKELKVGDLYQVLYAFQPTDATKTELAWKSSNLKVAVVDNKGEVRTISPGEATITALSSSGKKAEIKIIVKSDEEN